MLSRHCIIAPAKSGKRCAVLSPHPSMFSAQVLSHEMQGQLPKQLIKRWVVAMEAFREHLRG